MLINKTYRFRIYPTPQEEILINKTFCSTRLVYNKMLDKKLKDTNFARFD